MPLRSSCFLAVHVPLIHTVPHNPPPLFSGLSGLSWLDVVAPQDLIGVLGCDTPALSQRVHQLLLPSFLPDEESAPGLLVSLLRSQPEAGRRLCLYLAGGVESKAQDGTVLALPSGV